MWKSYRQQLFLHYVRKVLLSTNERLFSYNTGTTVVATVCLLTKKKLNVNTDSANYSYCIRQREKNLIHTENSKIFSSQELRTYWTDGWILDKEVCGDHAIPCTLVPWWKSATCLNRNPVSLSASSPNWHTPTDTLLLLPYAIRSEEFSKGLNSTEWIISWQSMEKVLAVELLCGKPGILKHQEHWRKQSEKKFVLTKCEFPSASYGPCFFPKWGSYQYFADWGGGVSSKG